MTNRIVSLSVLLCVVAVLIWGVLSPNNPLFFFISSNKWLSIARLILAASVVFISFKGIIRDPAIRKITWRLGIAMIAAAGSLLLYTQLQNVLVDYFKPLDLLLLVEAGVILSSASLVPAPTESEPVVRQLSLPLKAAKVAK